MTGSNSSSISRRGALRLFAGGASVAILAACGPTTPATQPPVPTSAAPAAPLAPAAATLSSAATPPAQAQASTPAPTTAQRRMGGTLRVAVPADISSLDGHTSSSILGITQAMAFDRLAVYDIKATPQPQLAESWEVSPDFKQVKLNLRKAVQWHSGRDFTSDDVKWNLLRGQDPKAATGSYVNQAKWFPDIETPDKYTVIMQSEVSRPAIFDYFNVLHL